VFSAPADEDVAAFVGVETIIPARVKAIDEGVASLHVAGIPLEVAVSSDVGENVLLCLRPEDVVVARLTEATPSTSARNHIAATVTRISPAGPHARVELNGGFPLVALITKQSLEELGLEPGTPVQATFKATAAHLIPHRSKQ
jgi:molybdopterin-binding protein